MLRVTQLARGEEYDKRFDWSKVRGLIESKSSAKGKDNCFRYNTFCWMESG